MPASIYQSLMEARIPELLNMPLEKICLTVKLLSPRSMVTEYLQETITKPQFIYVCQSIELLKKMHVFTELEDITWLGCRLIDLPVDCHLGKMLIFGVMLQCLDPVLTIASFMQAFDPFDLAFYLDGMMVPHKDLIRRRFKEERNRLSGNILSDHLVYLRLYQEWQNETPGDGAGSISLSNGNFSDESSSSNNVQMLYNEQHFLFHGILEQVSYIRTQLVGSLRSSQLIHNHGNLSMHYINQKSNCWPLVKAALVGGLYPNICLLDFECNRIKSPRKRELVVHPDSLLRDLELHSTEVVHGRFNTPWIVYGNETNSWNCNSVNHCTLISPASIALFAGSPNLCMSCIQIKESSDTAPSESRQCILYIDEWISFEMELKEAQLLLKARQCFFRIFAYYLENCNNPENFKNMNILLVQNYPVFECLERVLTREDEVNGFIHLNEIGLRPKAITTRYLANVNRNFNRMPEVMLLLSAVNSSSSSSSLSSNNNNNVQGSTSSSSLSSMDSMTNNNAVVAASTANSSPLSTQSYVNYPPLIKSSANSSGCDNSTLGNSSVGHRSKIFYIVTHGNTEMASSIFTQLFASGTSNKRTKYAIQGVDRNSWYYNNNFETLCGAIRESEILKRLKNIYALIYSCESNKFLGVVLIKWYRSVNQFNVLECFKGEVDLLEFL